jgi:hypothetical protein
LGRFITIAVDTEADQVNIKVLYSDLESTSSQIDISILVFCTAPPWYESEFLFPLAIVNHSKAKDQFLNVAVKRMIEIQPFEDELKEVSQLNSALSTQNQELEVQLAEGSQAKNGNIPLTPYFCN